MLTCKKVLVVHRTGSEKASQLATKVVQWLKARNINSYSRSNQEIKSASKIIDQDLKNIDLTLVIGGDGTYLEAIKLLGGLKIPILGVNMGFLGFLTNTPEKDIFSELDLALNNKLETRPRSMLAVSLQRDDEPLEKIALNDIVIERANFSQLISVDVYRNNQLVYNLKSDGLIISTPTGSTAYNLAAGGPILYPYVDATVVTPISPHSLTSRPVVFCAKDTLSFIISGNKNTKAKLTLDGKGLCNLNFEDKIIIEKASTVHYVLRKKGHNYFDILREKFQFGQRN